MSTEQAAPPSHDDAANLIQRMILPPKLPQRQKPKAKRKWWSLTGSNRRHPACKAGALPAELRPRIPYGFIVSASSAQFQSKPFTSRNPSGEARKHDRASATFGRPVRSVRVSELREDKTNGGPEKT